MATDVLNDVRLLRPREAAAALDISVRQLDRLVEAGALEAVHVYGNRVHFSLPSGGREDAATPARRI